MLWSLLNPGVIADPSVEKPRPQVFGGIVVLVNGKKHRRGDLCMVRIARGTSAKDGVGVAKITVRIESVTPSSIATEVADLIRRLNDRA